MRIKNKLFSVFSFYCIASLTYCGGGGSSGSSSSDSETVITTQSLTSLSNLPDFDLSALDAATSSSTANLSALRALVRNVEDEETQEFSRAGCEIRSQVNELRYQIDEFKNNVCIMKGMEEVAGMEVGNGDYNYYQLVLNMDTVSDDSGSTEGEDDGEGMTQYVRVKVGVVDDTLGLFICSSMDGTTFTQESAMALSAVDGKYNGTITNVYNYEIEGESESFANRLNIDIATDNPDEMGNDDTASISGEFSSSWGSGGIALDITKVGGVLKNTVNASFNSGNEETQSTWGSWLSQVYGEYEGSGGCSQFSSTGTFPAQRAGEVFPEQAMLDEAGLESDDYFCWSLVEGEGPFTLADFVEDAGDDQMCSFNDSNTECFTFETAEDESVSYWLDDSDSLGYYDSVSAVDLSTYEEPSISYSADEAWDCTAPAGFTTLTPTEEDMAATFHGCFNDVSDRSFESCYDQQADETVEQETGVEVEDPEQGGDDEGGEGGDSEFEDDCDDSIDNDSNGDVDCDDSACSDSEACMGGGGGGEECADSCQAQLITMGETDIASGVTSCNEDDACVIDCTIVSDPTDCVSTLTGMGGECDGGTCVVSAGP